jgi:hypothetical protein
MAALDDWFPGASTPDRRRLKRPITRPPHRLRAVAILIVGALFSAPVIAALCVPTVSGVGIGAREAVTAFENLPTDLPLDVPLPQHSVIYAADGKTVIARYYAENRIPVSLKQIPPNMVDAVIATEDDRFYQHGPLDVRGTFRAFAHNAGGGSRQGGSSITQQYVKNLLLTQAGTEAERAVITAKTLNRKLREARLAIEAERKLGKDGVLAAYLNTVYFGRGAYGVAAASQRFFGVPLTKLTLPQAALLAGMLKSPTNFDPISNPKLAKIRRDVVLDRMRDTGHISPAQAKAAQAVPLGVNLRPSPNGCLSSKWPFYCQLVLDTLASDRAFGATAEKRQDLLNRGGLTIVTSMDPAAMAVAQTAVSAALSPRKRVATASAVVEPGTGKVLAIATSKRWGTDVKKGQTEIVLPAAPKFQPGSTFKAITLATALEQGFSPYARIDTPDGYVPTNLNYPAGGFHNDDNQGHGSLNAFEATAQSVNTFYVQVIERTGVLPVADMAARLGMSSLPRTGKRAVGTKDAALTLGAFETSPLQMATVYATLAARGMACSPEVIQSVKLSEGTAIAGLGPHCQQVVAPAVADTVTSVLQTTFGATGTASGLELPDRPAAGKTGTTNNSGATWFAGFTPQLATAVWVGDPRGPTYSLHDVEAYGQTFSNVYGRSIAGPIWRQTMTDLSAKLPVKTFVVADPAALVGSAPSLPDVRGQARDVAIAVLRRAGYRVVIAPQTAAADALFKPGYVAAQSPKPNSPVTANSTVTLTLTAGSQTAVVIPGQSTP